MDVQPGDVKRYGSSAAIVLATLREQGCSATVAVAVTHSQIAALAGLTRPSVSRALDALSAKGAVRRQGDRVLRRVVLRLTHSAALCDAPDAELADCTTHGEAKGLPRPTALRRLDSLRSLLELAR